MTEKINRCGRLTLPSESNFTKETIELMERLGADAIRDSDGTKLPQEIKELDAKIYTTYFVARGHNDFAEKNMDCCQHFYLLSNRCVAKGNSLSINIMDGYFSQQIVPDYDHDPHEWWEVRNRTTGEIVPKELWQYNKDTNNVTIENTMEYCEYTVSFLAYAIWDPTQMYNHITNDWKDKPHEIPFDVRREVADRYTKDYLKSWLKENPYTDVVRFTTFFYHFTLVFNDLGKEKFVDWFGYSASVSPEAIEEFEKIYGYRLSPEDFVDQGYYNTTFRVPSRKFLDFMDFQQKFVAEKAKALVDLVHESGKEAVMFLGDNWIGTEPYGKYFPSIGLDAVAGSVNSGTTLRMLSGIPGIKYSEARFLPYFFPDTFRVGNDPTIEARENWTTARRGIMRKPVDRVGYGGYLSLAYKFPKFIDYVKHVVDEFRHIYDTIDNTNPSTFAKVYILNSWGKIRSWQCHMVAHALWYKQIYSYMGILECLSGMDVDVEFISFDDVIENGIPEDCDVLINSGDAYTAFSGGEYWKNTTLVTRVRKWVDNGGGFIGVGEPTAIENNGRYFQLADVLGVDKELGFSLSTDKYFNQSVDSHFIVQPGHIWDFGESISNVYALSKDTNILEYSNGELHCSVNDYGNGRGVYIAGLPYSPDNTRLLKRAIHFAAHKEESLYRYYSENKNVEVHCYEKIGKYAIVNNADENIETTFYDGDGKPSTIFMKPCEIRWMDL